jgi:8-oxo-dGTP diphosphatase
VTSPLKKYPMPFTRVELCALAIDDGRLAVLVGRREEAPYKGRWALPGGVLRIDLDSDLSAAAQRVAMERLGTALPYLRQQCAIGGKTRDPRSEWGMSVVYRALVRLEELAPKAGKRLEQVRWVPADEAINDRSLAFDHGKLIEAAVQALRGEVQRLDLPFEYLPATFTLRELQRTCEEILGKPLDKSSFRRRLGDRGCVEPAGEMRTGPNRPAQLFRPASAAR